MTKHQQKLHVLMLIAVNIGGLASLFLPYLEKLNIRSGDLSLPSQYAGHHYPLATCILIFMMSSVLVMKYATRKIGGLVLSIVVLFFLYILRIMIHSQGFIDHNYDSKTGVGFKFLFALGLAHFAICISAIILQRRHRSIVNKHQQN